MNSGTNGERVGPQPGADPFQGLRRGVNAEGFSFALLMGLEQIVGLDAGSHRDDDNRNGDTPQEAQ